MIDFFKAEDFNSSMSLGGIICQLLIRDRKAVYNEDAARVSNEKLAATLGPIIYFEDVYGLDFGRYSTNVNSAKATHQAYLFNLQEIKREPCAHEPDSWITQAESILNSGVTNCKHCGILLKATWNPA